MNKVFLLGRLGQDVELKYTQKGMSVASFPFATQKKWYKDGKQQEKTEWHRIVVWGKLAELCDQYLKKGSQAFIEGEITTRQWEANDGSKRYTTEINASSIQFLNSQQTINSESQKTSAQEPIQFEPTPDFNFAADDIPF